MTAPSINSTVRFKDKTLFLLIFFFLVNATGLNDPLTFWVIPVQVDLAVIKVLGKLGMYLLIYIVFTHKHYNNQ